MSYQINAIRLFKWLLPLLTSLILIAPNAMAQEKAYPDNIITVQKTKNIKIVYDINQNESAAGIGKGLYYVRGLLEAYKKQNVPMKELHISVVIHGDAGYWLLNEEKYQNFTGNPFDVNPNTKVVQELIDHGVSVEICHVTMKAHHWKPEDILPGVKIVFDAYTRIIDLQQQGYTYIKFS
ncbi:MULTISPECIES: DsrE family protein [Thiomicrorhabdus]|nr:MULTISPECIES: DsrE family protein [Thiomicrorhabdus]